MNDPPEIRKMETVLRAFTRRVSGLRDEPYCERLKLMQLQSQERRTERYKILYIQKIILGMVLNIGLNIDFTSRQGKVLKLISLKCAKDSVKELRDSTLMVEGALLFNSIPRQLREYGGRFLGFKYQLDKWLGQIPDVPRCTGFEPTARDSNGDPSNSVKDWHKLKEFKELDVIMLDFLQIE